MFKKCPGHQDLYVTGTVTTLPHVVISFCVVSNHAGASRFSAGQSPVYGHFPGVFPTRESSDGYTKELKTHLEDPRFDDSKRFARSK